MPTREEKIAFLKSQVSAPAEPQRVATREEKIEFLKAKSQESQDEKGSPIVAGVRNFVQGATAGFSDEIAGAVEGAGRVAGVKGLGGQIKDISLAESGPSLDWEVIKDAYKRARDKERENLKKDSEENFGIATAAQIAGGVVSPVNKIAKGMSLVKGGAAIGGVTGAGMSDADNIVDVGVDAAKGAALGGTFGYGISKASPQIKKGLEAVASKVSPPKKKLNSDEIIAAADRLGIKVTPGMLDDSGFVERLESALSKSPSVFGRSIEKQRRAVTDQLTSTGKELTSDASNLSPYQLGEKVKSGVSAKVAERLDPISTVFNEVGESTKHIPIGEKSLSAIKRNIENLDVYHLTGGAGKPSQYVDMIPKLKNADQVKTVMTLLNKDIGAAQGAEKQVLIAIKEKLSTLEKNSIMRGAIATAREGGARETTGKKIGSSIIGDLKDARRGYRELSKDLTEVSENARLKTRNGPSAFLDDLENIPSERIPDKFFNVENNRQLVNLKSKFPEQFELLKQGKLKEVLDGSIDNSVAGQGGFSSHKFLKAVRGLNDEAKSILCAGKTGVVKDMETVQRSLPRNFNPSGTAQEIGWQDAVYKNVKDIPTYLLYRGASSNLGKEISTRLANAPKMSELYKKNPQLYQSIVQKIEENTTGFVTNKRPILERAVDKKAPPLELKGKEKWAVSGYSNLLEHDKSGSLQNEKLVEKLFSDSKGKDLLISASDLKPGSKAMGRLFEKIENQYGKAK